MPLLVLSICLTCRFMVTVSALLSLVGPAHQLLLPLAAFKCDVFWANKFGLKEALHIVITKISLIVLKCVSTLPCEILMFDWVITRTEIAWLFYGSQCTVQTHIKYQDSLRPLDCFRYKCCLIKLGLPYIWFEKYSNILALEMASPGTGTVPVVSAHFGCLLCVNCKLMPAAPQGPYRQ